MSVNNDLVSLEEVNSERFSKMIATLSIDDPASYDIVIATVTKAKNLSGAAKANYLKGPLDIDADLLDAIKSYVSFQLEVTDE